MMGAAPGMPGARACVVLCALTVSPAVVVADPPVVRLDLITGTGVSGLLLGETDRVVLVDVDGFPCAFAYDQVLPDSAYRAKLGVIRWRRGGRGGATAADSFALGEFALRHGRVDVARRDFQTAAKRDPAYRARSDRALAEFRAARGVLPGATVDAGDADVAFPSGTQAEVDVAAESRRRGIIEGYKAVGEQIGERLGQRLTLLETPHFLIWTDWAKAEHPLLRTWCEQMFASLAARFGVSEDSQVFAGKCPVFCMRSRRRFVAIAQLLDDFDVTGAVGYTSYDGNGHVHVVVCRPGGSPAARDAFAGTLIHEGTHAFMHRYRPGGRLPPWISEGLANHVSQSVLGDRCPYAEAAGAVARAIVGRKHPIDRVFSDDSMLEARYYPVAHSLVAFLIERDAAGFVRLIDDLKAGAPTGEALERNYKLSVATLEDGWRRWVR